MNRILFVCLGNICRSPGAEAIFAKMAADAGLPVSIDSAGTSGWHVGDPPYGPMISAAALRGFDLTPLRARVFVPSDFDHFDLILGMDMSNIENIEASRPKGNNTPVKLLMSYADLPGTAEVPDPYYTRDFDQTLELVEIACRGLLATLNNTSTP